MQTHCSKRKHPEDGSFIRYIASGVSANMKDGGEFVTLDWHKRFAKLKKSAMKLFGLVNTRPELSKRVLQFLQKGDY